jgi:hypothetical protein
MAAASPPRPPRVRRPSFLCACVRNLPLQLACSSASPSRILDPRPGEIAAAVSIDFLVVRDVPLRPQGIPDPFCFRAEAPSWRRSFWEPTPSSKRSTREWFFAPPYRVLSSSPPVFPSASERPRSTRRLPASAAWLRVPLLATAGGFNSRAHIVFVTVKPVVLTRCAPPANCCLELKQQVERAWQAAWGCT